MSVLIEPRTDRLQLRQWREADFAPLAALNADPRVMECFPSPLSREQSDAMALRLRTALENRGWGLWAVELLSSGEFIGFVGLKDVPVELPFSPAVEIGWRLAHAHWSRGYASEAARAALFVAFNSLRLSEVVSFTAVPNTRSRRVMERLGMVADDATFEHPLVPAGSPLTTHCLYRMSQQQWRVLQVNRAAAIPPASSTAVPRSAS